MINRHTEKDDKRKRSPAPLSASTGSERSVKLVGATEPRVKDYRLNQKGSSSNERTSGSAPESIVLASSHDRTSGSAPESIVVVGSTTEVLTLTAAPNPPPPTDTIELKPAPTNSESSYHVVPCTGESRTSSVAGDDPWTAHDPWKVESRADETETKDNWSSSWKRGSWRPHYRRWRIV